MPTPPKSKIKAKLKPILKPKERLGAETTCPQCWLDPLAVVPGQPRPIEFGPGKNPVGVDCPDCGLVYYETSDKEEPYSPGRREIMECLREDRRRGTRNGGGGSKGPKREAVPPSPLALDLEWPGFPESRQATIEMVSRMSAPIYPTITREVDTWLSRAALALDMPQSQVVRWALEWARLHSPKLSNKRLESQWPQRRRMCVLLRENEKPILADMAARARTPRLGHYVAQVLDLIQRKPTIQTAWCALIDESRAKAFE